MNELIQVEFFDKFKISHPSLSKEVDEHLTDNNFQTAMSVIEGYGIKLAKENK